ncbi:MAG: AsmA family protein, partial [Gallionellaceae bacterium]
MSIKNFLLRHPFAAKSFRLLAIFGAALLLTILYIALIGVSIDLANWRGKAATLLTQNLGREVRFDGPLQLEISAHPKLRIGGLHIANATGFEGGDFASLGEARLALDLWPLLRMRFQVEELAGSDVHARLQVKKDGTTNWKFNPPQPKQEIEPKAKPSSVDLAQLLAALDIKRVALEKLDVEFIGANQKSHFFELQSLVAQFPAGEPISLTLHGTVEKTAPYQLEFTGGTVADLAHLEKPWPIDLKLDFMSSHLTLRGSLSETTDELNFGLDTENLSEFEQLFQIKLPAV